MGTDDHSRSRRVTSMPSVSGRLRSRITISGCSAAATSIACRAVAASSTLYPRAASDTRRNRLIATSSSTTSTRAPLWLIPPSSVPEVPALVSSDAPPPHTVNCSTEAPTNARPRPAAPRWAAHGFPGRPRRFTRN